ncbi:immunoglobulin superfamily member 3 [Anguilla anguilla]|uniref:immunoglobulin superfamily member 3 n=1 Tax=Anguilla anguilla TaxID=7936 RepID=UPI0015B0A352|nr:immunoglobulin superfamily member 3 [Anguilla anguilla]
MNRLWGCALLLCLNGLLRWDVCDGQRVVDMQEGPLYRAKGYPVTISCTVSGFKGPSEQTFQFSVNKPTRPDMEINIVSTSDPNYSYAVYSQRVSAGEIQIQRLTGSSVLLHINKLEESDVGDYQCSTPNTDGAYFGTYFAKTTLNVIQDTLSASANPTVLSKTEGEALQLKCEVSSQTFQHTHLSVTWFLQSKGDGQPRPIISLNRDFTLSPGEGFEDRYQAGFVSLDKVQGTTYRLSMSQLQLSDQGSVYCQASEWIQDPDRSWYKIAYKDSEAFTLHVQPIDVLPDSDSFNARIEAPGEDLREGDTLEIQCTVEARDVVDSYFSVAWLKDDKEMAGIGPTGVSSIGPDYAGRESEGELKVVKKSDRDYLLAVRPVRTEDAGKYLCRVWKEEKAASSFTRGQSQDSAVKHVAVTVAERKLAVSAPSSTLEVNEGDVLQVTCGVSGASGLQSVSWQHRPGQGAFSDVISLSRNGVMQPGTRYRQRAEMGDVRTLRAAPESFTLEIANALPSDAGTYKCTVSDWVTETKGNVKKLDSKSQEVNTEVRSVDSLIRAELRSRTVLVRENEKIELFCKVKGPRYPLSVTWKIQRSGSPSQEQIVSLFHDGVITWWKNQRSYQLRTQVQPDEVTFILKVFRASAQEAGTYQCVVEAFLRQTQKALKSSNVLAVRVQKPDSLLSVSAGPQTPLRSRVGADARMECAVRAATTNASRFAVSWLFQPEGGQNRTLLHADRDAVLEVEAGQRYSLSRREARSYELLLRQAGTADSGRYYCLVEEWLQDPHGDWAPLKSTSAVIQLLISPQESSFSVTKEESKVTVRESEQVHINCSLGPGSISPASHYSITWFFVPAGSSERTVLLRFSHDAVLDHPGVRAELVRRMRFHRPALGSFGLTVQNVDAQDSGGYSCQVDEYRLSCEGEWLQSATDQSGVTSVSVLQTESNLHVLKDNSVVTMGNQQDGFVIVCNITSYSSPGSVFEVTWWRREAGGEGEPHPIFRARRNFTLQHLDKSRAHLLFDRPQATLYTLTVPNAEPSDSGQYYCRVEEWLLSPRNTWRKIAEDSSGHLTVSFQPQAGSTFAVLKPDTNITVQEGAAAVLQCRLQPGSVSPASHYSVTWFFVPADSSERTVLLRFSHDAVLDHPGVRAELVRRMRFHRPALGSFGLTVQNVDAQDSGGYSCQVDEYRLSCEGEWLQSATDQSGVTRVSVLHTESDLHVLKHDDNVTMGNQQGDFVIVCNITSYSSPGSVFQVTWWRREAGGEGEPRPIFIARRNFTLQHLDKSRAHLLFDRPQATLYTLTVPNAEPSDSGQYYCRVEEWLLSPRNTWRKIAEDSSGHLTVSFRAQGAGKLLEASCTSGALPVVLSLLIALLALAIGVLAYKLRKAGRRTAKRQADESLWAESNPLKPKLES